MRSSLAACAALVLTTSAIRSTAVAQTPELAAPLTRPGVQSMNPDLSLVLGTAAAAFSADDPLQSGAHDPQENGFNLQQLELAVSSSVDPYFRFDAFIVFGQFGVELEEAVATTLALPASLQLRAGQFLTRFGRFNSTHPHAWDFVDQPFAIGRVMGGEANRGLGVELSWLAPLPWYVELVGSLTDAAGEGTARSFYGAQDLGVRSPLDLQGTFALKQFFAVSDDWSLAWGLSAAGGPNPTGHSNRSDIYGTDVYLRYRPVSRAGFTTVSLHSEWLYRRRQIPHDVLQDVNGFAALALRFAQRWWTAARYEHGSPAYDLKGRRTTDNLDEFWTEARHRGAANLTFTPTEFSRLRLQVSADSPGWRPDPVLAAFLAFEVSVGAHGAHPF